MRMVSLLIAAGIGCGLVLSGCDLRDPLSPARSETPLPGPRSSSAASAYSGAFDIPVPSQNFPDNGVVNAFPVATKDSIWVRIRVEGEITLSANPQYLQLCSAGRWHDCPPPHAGKQVGPDGLAVAGQFARALQVTGRIQATKYAQTIYFGADGATSNNVQYVWIDKGAVLTIQRSAIPSTALCLSTSCTAGGLTWSGAVPYYAMSGTQGLHVEEVPVPIRVQGPTGAVPGDAVTFTAEQDMPFGSIRWYFSRWDTNVTPLNPADLAGSMLHISACENSLTCHYAPPTSGRMYVSASAYGIYSARAISEVIWMGPQLELECKGPSGSSTVTRGESATCTAKTRPTGASLTIQSWRFTDGATTVDATMNGPEWYGTMVVGGSVTVTGSIDGRDQSATASITVAPRQWPRIVVMAVDGGHGGEQGPNTFQTDQPREVRELGHAHYPELSGNLDEQRVSSGPNQGYWYIASPVTSLTSVVHISRAFTPGHPWYEMQRGGSGTLNGIEYRYCRKADIRRLERVTRQHEGLLPSPTPSHVSAFNSFYQASDVQNDLETVIAHDSDLGSATFQGYAMAQFVHLVLNPLGADNRYEHTVDGGTVPFPSFPCQPRFYP